MLLVHWDLAVSIRMIYYCIRLIALYTGFWSWQPKAWQLHCLSLCVCFAIVALPYCCFTIIVSRCHPWCQSLRKHAVVSHQALHACAQCRALLSWPMELWGCCWCSLIAIWHCGGRRPRHVHPAGNTWDIWLSVGRWGELLIPPRCCSHHFCGRSCGRRLHRWSVVARREHDTTLCCASTGAIIHWAR